MATCSPELAACRRTAEMRPSAASQAGSVAVILRAPSQKFFSSRLAAWAGASAASDNTTAAAEPIADHTTRTTCRTPSANAPLYHSFAGGERFDPQIRSAGTCDSTRRLGMLPPANSGRSHAVCVLANIKPEAGGVERPRGADIRAGRLQSPVLWLVQRSRDRNVIARLATGCRSSRPAAPEFFSRASRRAPPAPAPAPRPPRYRRAGCAARARSAPTFGALEQRRALLSAEAAFRADQHARAGIAPRSSAAAAPRRGSFTSASSSQNTSSRVRLASRERRVESAPARRPRRASGCRTAARPRSHWRACARD